jgi:hypothetical protein
MAQPLLCRRAMARHIVLFLSAVLLASACGGSIDGQPSPNGRGSGSVTPETAKSLAGSYNLVIATIDAVGDVPSRPPAPIAKGKPARLDIGATASGELDVILTPLWGQPAPLRVVSTTATSIELTGRVVFPLESVADTWEPLTLVFPRNADGKLGASFTAKGKVKEGRGDWMEENEVTASGTLGPDTLAPEMRLVPADETRGSKRLPWDPIEVELSEPLDPAPFNGTLGTLSELDWSTAPAVGEASSFSGRAGQVLLSATSRPVASPDGVVDRSGNALAPFQQEVIFHDVGWYNDAITFDADAHLATWGNAARSQQSLCGGSGCLVFRPGEEAAGFAGIITPTKPATVVRARVRVYLADDPSFAKNPRLFRLPFGLDVHAKGQRKIVAPQTITVTRTEEQAAMPWSTEWLTLEATLPPETKEIGVAFLFQTCIPSCDNTSYRAFVVDSVRAE